MTSLLEAIQRMKGKSENEQVEGLVAQLNADPRQLGAQVKVFGRRQSRIWGGVPAIDRGNRWTRIFNRGGQAIIEGEDGGLYEIEGNYANAFIARWAGQVVEGRGLRFGRKRRESRQIERPIVI